MIDKNELLFVVDESNNPIEPKPRSDVHSKGYWHRTVHIWIYNKDKQVLCQKRSLKKDSAPGVWEPIFGGHVLTGEDLSKTAVKELNEELGLTANPGKLTWLMLFQNQQAKEFEAIYLLTWDGMISDLKPEKEEVDELRWFPIEEVKKMILEDKNPNWNNFGYEQEVFNRLAS